MRCPSCAPFSMDSYRLQCAAMQLSNGSAAFPDAGKLDKGAFVLKGTLALYNGLCDDARQKSLEKSGTCTQVLDPS
jgi:hypothetical protein